MAPLGTQSENDRQLDFLERIGYKEEQPFSPEDCGEVARNIQESVRQVFASDNPPPRDDLRAFLQRVEAASQATGVELDESDYHELSRLWVIRLTTGAVSGHLSRALSGEAPGLSRRSAFMFWRKW